MKLFLRFIILSLIVSFSAYADCGSTSSSGTRSINATIDGSIPIFGNLAITVSDNNPDENEGFQVTVNALNTGGNAIKYYGTVNLTTNALTAQLVTTNMSFDFDGETSKTKNVYFDFPENNIYITATTAIGDATAISERIDVGWTPVMTEIRVSAPPVVPTTTDFVITVTAIDQFGTQYVGPPNYTGTVTVNATGLTSAGNPTLTLVFPGGVASQNINDAQLPADGSLTISATDGTYSDTTSVIVTDTPRFSSIVVTPDSPVYANDDFDIQVDTLNQYGIPIAPPGPITLSDSAGSGITLSSETGLTLNFGTGTSVTLNDCQFSPTWNQNATVTATEATTGISGSGASTILVLDTINVTAPALVITNTPFSVVVDLLDQFANPFPFTGPIDLSIIDTGASLTSATGLTIEFDNDTTQTKTDVEITSADVDAEIVARDNTVTGVSGQSGDIRVIVIISSTVTNLKSLCNALSGYDENTDETTVFADIQAEGFFTFAIPTHGNLAEAMDGTDDGPGWPDKGWFVHDTNAPYELGQNDALITPTTGFPDDVANGKMFMAMALFGDDAFQGILIWVFDTAAGGEIMDIFVDEFTQKTIYPYVLDSTGTIIDSDPTGSTTWTFSDGHNPDVNTGYYNTDEFSDDDGTWGFRIGGSADGNGGPALDSTFGVSTYGFENQNAGDTSGAEIWWNSVQTADTNHVGYVFTLLLQ